MEKSLKNRGQSLIEIIVAMGLIAILLPAIFTGLAASREGKAQEDRRLQATALLREAEEVVRSVREKDWAEIATAGIYHPGSEYEISICQFDGCPPEFTSYTGTSDASGNVNAVFSPTTNQAAFEVWITETAGPTPTSGIIESISLSGLADGTDYIVYVCSEQNCWVPTGGTQYSSFSSQSSNGNMTATFSYAPSFTGTSRYEVWVTQDPTTTGCTGFGCFVFANINSMVLSGFSSNSDWSLASGPETINDFTREIEISDVQRDLSGNIVTSGGTIDPSTKLIATTVSWTTPVASSVESSFYITRHLENTGWLQTSDAHFNSGTHNGTITVGTGISASIELNPTPSGGVEYGNQFLVDSVEPMVWLIVPSVRNDIRFTAQNSKTVDRVRLYVHNIAGISPTYRVGIQSDNGGNPSGTYLGSSTFQPATLGWHSIDISNTPITSGRTYHIVIQYETGAIGFGNYIQFRNSTPLNSLYPFDNSQDTQANTGYFFGGSWNYTNNQPIYAIQFTDSSLEGNPFSSGDEFETYGTIYHGEQFTVPSSITVSDINWLVRQKAQQNPQGPLVVRLENITGGTTLAQGNIATGGSVSQTYSNQTYTFNPAITLLPGNNYRITVRAPSASEARAYMIKRVNNQEDLSLNSINYDGTNSVYAVLWPGLAPGWDAAGWYFTAQSAAGDGTFTSQVFDAGQEVAFNNITWSETLPNQNTNIQLQVSVDGGPFVGPTGAASFYDNPGAIPLNSTVGQTIQFRASLSGPGAVTPVLHDVNINYSP